MDPIALDLDRPQWIKSIPFFAVHLVALASPLLAPPTWRLAALAASVYAVLMFGITAGFHRYFSHRAFKTGRAFQLVLAALGTLSVQKGVLWWAAHHRNHHRYSDGPEDVHSPVQRGFWWSHVGWILSARHDATRIDRVRDLARFPELRWLDRYGFCFLSTFASGLFLAGGLPWVLWGFFVPVTVVWHVTFSINSVAHVLGRRRYPTGDDSRNSAMLALLTFGEGWHNNHHFYPTTANQGWFWWEVDVSYYALRGLAALGLVSDLRTPPKRVRDGIALSGDATGSAGRGARSVGQGARQVRETPSGAQRRPRRASAAGPGGPVPRPPPRLPGHRRCRRAVAGEAAPCGSTSAMAREATRAAGTEGPVSGPEAAAPAPRQASPGRSNGALASSLPTMAHGTMGTADRAATRTNPPRPNRCMR